MRMDPKRAVLALIDSGWSEQQIARETATNQATINRIKSGERRDCRYSLGVRLVALAEREAAKAQQPTQSEAA